MILLSGHSLTPARKVPVESMSLTLKERESTASLTPADMEGIGISSWLRDETDPGAGIVWRVKSIRTVFATRTPTVELEHVINTLRDRLLFGEIKPGTITGNTKSTTCTAEQAVRYILRQQSDWVLGSFSYGNVANPYKFDGDSLFDALETVTNSLSNAMWTYDMSVYPFRLNIVQKPTAVESEMRAGRNIRTITRTVDKSGMYTRFYPIGANDKKIAGGYVEKNTDAYGVVSHVETDQTLGTEGELRAWANERLNLHAEPTVTIEVEGFELAAATGESLDRLTLMRICRMPLPEFGTTIQERIVALNYPDKTRQPESVKVTLTNNRQDITKILADAMKKGGRSARASSRKNAEDLAWFEDTNDHVAMCAKGIIGTDAAGNPNWVRLSEIVVDGTGIHQQVQSVQKDVVIANTKIDQNEYAIQMEANKRIDADKTMQGRLDVTATRVGMVVGTKDGKDFIKAAEICVAINDDGSSSAIIDANKVYIGNQKSTTVINGKCSLSDVTAQYISAQIATLSSLTVSGANVIGDIYLRNAGGNQQNVNGGIWDLNIKNNNNGTYTLQRKRFSDTDYVDVGTFNTAGAVTLNDPVWTTPASTSPGSNSNTVTVSTSGRSPQLSKSVQVTLVRSDSWSSGTRTVYITHTDSDPSRRVAKIDVTIPNPTNLSGITTHGNSPPSGAYSFGTLSKSGLTAGKYMSMTCRFGGKTFTFYFQAVA
jgi:phage minor structural protein